MKTFKIIDGDITFDGQNDIAMVEGEEEEAQCIERALSTNEGEWFLNILHGLNRKVIQTKGIDEESIRLELMKTISQEERVAEIQELDLQFEKRVRKLHIYFKVRMHSGNTLQGEEVLNIV